MKLYHGSDVIASVPQILISNNNHTVDFGSGFYTTTNQIQANLFSKKVQNRNESNNSYVSVYEFNRKDLNKLKVLVFKSANRKWLDFVTNNRAGIKIKHDYDLIIGSVADDRVYKVLTACERGAYTIKETLKRLKIDKLFDQYVFITTKSLSFLSFIDSYIPQELD